MVGLTSEELEVRFGSGRKSPKNVPSKAPIHRDLRGLVKAFAAELNARLPEGRYKDLALDTLESSASWAHKSIQNDL